MRTAIVFAVFGDHEHHLPFEYVVTDQPAAYTGYAALHLLQLAAQEPGGR